jgi:phosphoribosyl 1,2-cyclic phosphate phosphodiesterase
MRVTFLGTGTSHGVPMIGCDCAVCRSSDPRDARMRPSIFVETPDASVLVDAGPDLRTQALRHRIRRVDAILLTHGHADHILGMDDVRRFNSLMKGPMACYGDGRTLNDVRKTFHYVFDPTTPKGGGLPALVLHEIDGSVRVGDLTAIAVPVWHGQRLILGYRIGGFAYLTDCSAIPDESWPLLDGLDVVVLDALRPQPHPTHFSLAQAIEAAERIGARQTLFTHMCHHLPHEATNATLPAGMSLAYDGLTVDL